LHHIFLLAGFSVGETVTLMAGFAMAGVAIGLGGHYLKVPDLYLALLFLAGGVFYYSVIRRAWRVMRFLRRSICRRTEPDSVSNRRLGSVGHYSGMERRSGSDRRDSGD
jgi:UDP-GlcNAc:undecaprenyl-phosphate GlcNAc-1-phosphate transferase